VSWNGQTYAFLSYLIAWSTLPFGGFLAFAPLVSAIVVVLIAEGLPGLARLGRRLIKWRVNWIWYAAAIGVPLLVHAVSIALNMAAGAPAPSVTQFQPGYAVLLLFGLRMVNPLDGPVAEEPGWRGFAQPRLQSKWSPLASTAVLGVLITGWHLPLVLMPICPADTHWKIGYCTPCIEARRSGSDHAHLAPGDAGFPDTSVDWKHRPCAQCGNLAVTKNSRGLCQICKLSQQPRQ
jgi:membrane protease YdiL (CAAX protease family)